MRNKSIHKDVKILGVVEDINVCDRCGKTGLEKTYAIEVEGVRMHLGSYCIGHRFQMTPGETMTFIKKELQSIKEKKRWEIHDATAELEEELFVLECDHPDSSRIPELKEKIGQITEEISQKYSI